MSEVISLKKKETISLKKKESNDSLWNFGSNWAMIEKSTGLLSGFFGKKPEYEAVDLDTFAILVKPNGSLDYIYFGNLNNYSMNTDGIYHSGDDRTGDSVQDDKDNEIISMNLGKLSEKYDYVILGIYSFRGHCFNDIPFMDLNIRNGKTKVANFHISNTPEMKGMTLLTTGFIDTKTLEFTSIGKTSYVESASIKAAVNQSHKDCLDLIH